MTVRIGILMAVAVLAAAALWHPAPAPTVQPIAAPSTGGVRPHPFANDGAFAGNRRFGGSSRPGYNSRGGIAYVAGAVRRPGLYPVQPGERADGAVAAAGGFAAGADAAGVNLAASVADGDEVYVPLQGEAAPRSSAHRASHRRSHRRSVLALDAAPASVDVNAAGEAELAQVPGIGAAIAARIVALRAVDGSFTALDQLLDVAGMTATRLERARPYLRDP